MFFVAAQEISDYLIARAQLSWMLDLMVACQEVSSEHVALLRHSDALAAGAPAVAECPIRAMPNSAAR